MKYASKAREKIVQAFIDSLSEDIIPWEQPWHVNEFYNPSTEKRYTGSFNLMVLNYYAFKCNYHDPRWMTYRQAQEKGWQVKSGEHGVPIEFWSAYNAKTKKKLTMQEANQLLREDADARDYIRFISKSYTVFNAEQIDHIPELPPKELIDRTKTLARIEKIANGMGVLQKEGVEAYYAPLADQVIMPPLQSFDSEKAYCATFLHELAHATGHESRLNRGMKNSFGSPEYAKEEMRAEIASAFMMGMLDVEYDESHMESHKSYVGFWIDTLKNDPDELFKAIKDAELIQDYMSELCPEQIKDVSAEQKQFSLDERIAAAKQKAEFNAEQDNRTREKEAQEVMV